MWLKPVTYTNLKKEYQLYFPKPFNYTNIFPDHVSFDKSNTVQIFEANIRVLGGLLSAHLLMEDFHGMIAYILFTFF